jgi:hypothetical protein
MNNDGKMSESERKSHRDLVAVFAMQGMLAHGTRYKISLTMKNLNITWHEALARESYEIADAMLEARDLK